MNKQTEALKLALEALCKMIPCDDVCDCSGQRAIIALQEALAEQPAQQQEPVAKKTRIGLVTSYGWDSLPVGTEFYTSPQAQRTWVGITDDEVEAVPLRQPNGYVGFARAIEAKLKEKNT